MNRLEHMRLYRSRLSNEVRALIDNHVANGTSPADVPFLADRICVLQARVRLMNVEIDKLEAIRYGLRGVAPEVPQEALTA
jgi:hypothetical protein